MPFNVILEIFAEPVIYCGFCWYNVGDQGGSDKRNYDVGLYRYLAMLIRQLHTAWQLRFREGS